MKQSVSGFVGCLAWQLVAWRLLFCFGLAWLFFCAMNASENGGVFHVAFCAVLVFADARALSSAAQKQQPKQQQQQRHTHTRTHTRKHARTQCLVFVWCLASARHALLVGVLLACCVGAHKSKQKAKAKAKAKARPTEAAAGWDGIGLESTPRQTGSTQADAMVSHTVCPTATTQIRWRWYAGGANQR